MEKFVRRGDYVVTNGLKSPGKLLDIGQVIVGLNPVALRHSIR
jgi:hypothetical protein